MEILQVNEDQQKKLATVLKNFRIQLFEYIVDEDKLVVYDDKFHIKRTVTDYMEYIDHKSKIHPDDREKVKQLYMEVKEDPVEIREIEKDGTISHTLLELTKFVDEATGKTILVGNAKDITEQKEHEKMLKEQAMKDPLTGIYNQIYGKMLINRYLNSKNPFEACGMILLDIDYFKAVNDHYGHLFGDKIILSLTDLLKKLFSDKNSVLVRAGGDEFVIFIANSAFTLPFLTACQSLLSLFQHVLLKLICFLFKCRPVWNNCRIEHFSQYFCLFAENKNYIMLASCDFPNHSVNPPQ